MAKWVFLEEEKTYRKGANTYIDTAVVTESSKAEKGICGPSLSSINDCGREADLSRGIARSTQVSTWRVNTDTHTGFVMKRLKSSGQRASECAVIHVRSGHI